MGLLAVGAGDTGGLGTLPYHHIVLHVADPGAASRRLVGERDTARLSIAGGAAGAGAGDALLGADGAAA